MNIGAPKALWVGIGRASRNWKLLALFYAMNFLFAAVLALPFTAVFAKDISRSLVGSRLLAGFDYRWYVEFIHSNGGYFDSLLPQLVLLVVLYLAMEVFLAGGFYSAFSSSGKTKMGAFFAAGASKFFPLAAVTIAEILLLVILYKLDAVWVTTNGNAAREALTDYRVLYPELWRYGAAAAAFVLVNMFSDFVRAAVTIDDDTFLSKIHRGLSFVLKHPLSSAGVYLGCAILNVTLAALYFFLNSGVHSAVENTIMLDIFVGQIFILLRIFSKLIFYAGEAALYKENQIEVINVKPEMLE